MKVVLIVAAAIVVLIAFVLAVGASLPKKHTASRSMTFARDRNALYAIVRDVASAPQWREGVTKVEMLDDRRFREHSKNGAVTYEIIEDDPGRRFSTRIVDRDLGYSGSWTYACEDAPPGSRLTITENGEVTNILFRFMSRFVFGHHASIDRYVRDLEHRTRSAAPATSNQ
jgi:polyketide cyclase/dehydrase/lipid transport protein